MSVNNRPLGIISCPGSHVFTQQLITHLKRQTKKRFLDKMTAMAKAYNVPESEIVASYNYANDLASGNSEVKEENITYREPNFEIETRFTRFANGEIKTEILSTIREYDIYIVQDVYGTMPASYYGSEAAEYNVNDHLITLLTTIDAVRVSSPARITCVLPAYPYARQHKKTGREGLTAALVGRILEDMGVERIITLDIHSKDIDHTFKNLHLENLYASYQITEQLLGLIDPEKEDLVVVAPDTGAVDRNKFFANNLKRPLAMLYKERDYSIVSSDANKSNISTMRMLGDVKGKAVFIVDDMLGTGGTLIKALQIMKEMGATKVIIGISLPLFTADAIEQFDKAYQDGLFYRIIGCNAVSHSDKLLGRSWYISADVSPLFASVVRRLNNSDGLGSLFDSDKLIQDLLLSK